MRILYHVYVCVHLSSTLPITPRLLTCPGPRPPSPTNHPSQHQRTTLPQPPTKKKGAGTRPRGLLVLRGEDFGDPHMAQNVSSYVATIKGLLFEHVTKCQGHAVVIFDEAGGVFGWLFLGGGGRVGPFSFVGVWCMYQSTLPPSPLPT